MPADDQVRRWMYDRAFDNYKLLTRMRFKVLSTAPVLSGLGVALTNTIPAPIQIALGCVGALVTLGVILHDRRNSSRYEDAIDCATEIERSLRREGILATEGVFSYQCHRDEERSETQARRFLGLFTMREDRAIAIVYAASLAGWVFVVAHGVQELSGFRSYVAPAWAAGAFAGLGFEFSRLRINRP